MDHRRRSAIRILTLSKALARRKKGRIFHETARVTGHGQASNMREHPKDPLHGITLEALLREMVERYGWDELAARIPVRCFMFDPSIKSSLTFLRKTPWARKRLEDWFVAVK